MFTHYAELQCTTNYSYLRGASHPEELVKQAAQLGLYALAITDENTLGGVVRAHSAAKDAGLKLLIGARITPVDGPDVLLYATNRAAYGRLARLITIGKSNAIQPPRTTAPSSADRIEKGTCRLSVDDIVAHSDDLIALVSPFSRTRSESTQPSPIPPALIDAFRGRLYIAATRPYGPDDAARLRDLRCLADAHRLPLAATNDVHYHAPARRQMQDALTCIRERCAISEAGYRLFANAERHLKPADEMCRLFRDMPAAIDATTEITDRCRFSLDELRYEYPVEIAPSGLTPMAHLTQLTWRGARERFPDGTPDKVRRQIEHELQLIEELSYEAYFLTVYDVVRFARSRGILCQGRGSAANSAVCYCIGVTSVDPARVDLLFERFISRERNEPPDIDVDFEHERREEVIQYIYARFGRDRAGLTAENITYRPRSAVRDVGKALGLSLDCVDRLARSCDWWDAEALPAGRLAELGLDPARHTTQLLVKLTRTLLTFPRHRSQHVGGFVITRGPLCELVPIENAAMPDRTVIEWDKDDIDALGILKVDVLGLGMLTAIGRAFRMVEGRGGMRHEGTKARRHEGEEEERHEGTEARRHEGEEEERHEGTEARDEGEEGALRYETDGAGQKDARCAGAGLCGLAYDAANSPCWVSCERDQGHGNHSEFPRPRGVAKGNEIGQGRLSSKRDDAQNGTFWIEDSNATLGCVRSLQHRGGLWTAEQVGLFATPANCEGIVGGTGHTIRTGGRYENDRRGSGTYPAACRGGSDSAGSDSQSGEDAGAGPPESGRHRSGLTNKGHDADALRELGTLSAPPCQHPDESAAPPPCVGTSSSLPLRAFVPSCLRASSPAVVPSLALHTVPPEDPAVYDMICRADTVGVFQIESRGQMSMLPRLKPRNFYDLVIEVAILRPGPIQGNMVHPFLRRRNGEEPATYPNDAVRAVLEKTLGVPLFQEQVMRLAVVAAGFTGGEADRLRRAMAAFRRYGEVEQFYQRFVEGMLANGYERALADQLFDQIRGFGAYGFPESHAASFALLVYVSAWLKRYHPAAFTAALLNSQPMGFYAPAQLVRDAREHGVEVRGVDVNESEWDCALEDASSANSHSLTHELAAHDSRVARACGPCASEPRGVSKRDPHAEKECELFARVRAPETERRAEYTLQDRRVAHEAESPPPARSRFAALNAAAPAGDSPADWGRSGPAMRLGLRMVKGLPQTIAEAITAARKAGGPFRSMADLARRAGLGRATLERLARANAFAGMGLHRRAALWEILALDRASGQTPLFDALTSDEPAVELPDMPLGQGLVYDYHMVGLSLEAHPVELARNELDRRGVISAGEIADIATGRWVRVAGLVICRQRPETAHGVMFVTLEDETGTANVIVRPPAFEKQRRQWVGASMLSVFGRIERQGAVTHILARNAEDCTDLLPRVTVRSRNFH